MISHQYRFIQFHIPRTGGSSVRDALWRYREDEKAGPHPKDHPDFFGEYDWHLYGFNPVNGPGRVGGGSSETEHIGHEIHNYVVNFLAQDSQPYSLSYGKEKFNEYFKFAFVRNPWDRFVSLWIKFKEDRNLRENFNSIYNLPEGWIPDEMEEVLRFLWLADKKGMLLPRWWKPQYEFVHNKELRVLTNLVGRYENLQHNFGFLCEKWIDYPKRTLPWSEDKYRRREKEKKHYTEFYVPRTRDMIADIYREDIRTWHYEFEN